MLGIDVLMEQILLIEFGIYVVDLICCFLFKFGDCVLVDDLSYFNYYVLFKVYQVQVVGVLYMFNGLDFEVFECVLQDYLSWLYIINFGLYNLIGVVFFVSIVYCLLGLVECSELIIIEDDIFVDFELQLVSWLVVFDGLLWVIYVGSFFKMLLVVLCCGYIVVCYDWIEVLIDLKLVISFGGGYLVVQLMYVVLIDSGY